MCFCSFADFGRATLAAWSVCLSACGCARICFQVVGRCMCVYSCMQLLCVFSCWFLVLKVIEHIHPSLHGCYGNSKRKLNVKLYFEKTFNRPWTPSSDYTVLYTSLSYAPLPSESAAFLHFSFLGPEMWISSSQGLTNGTECFAVQHQHLCGCTHVDPVERCCILHRLICSYEFLIVLQCQRVCAIL